MAQPKYRVPFDFETGRYDVDSLRAVAAEEDLIVMYRLAPVLEYLLPMVSKVFGVPVSEIISHKRYSCGSSQVKARLVATYVLSQAFSERSAVQRRPPLRIISSLLDARDHSTYSDRIAQTRKRVEGNTALRGNDSHTTWASLCNDLLQKTLAFYDRDTSQGLMKLASLKEGLEAENRVLRAEAAMLRSKLGDKWGQDLFTLKDINLVLRFLRDEYSLQGNGLHFESLLRKAKERYHATNRST